MDGAKLRVVVLFGGRSGEHDISLLSAAAIIKALNTERYEIIPVAISRLGKWLLLADVDTALSHGIDEAKGQAVILSPQPDMRGLLLLESGPAGGPGTVLPVDVVFPVLHGPYGEDGTVQGLLRLANLPFVGADVLGSAVAMDKGIMKDLFVRHGLPTPRYQVVRAAEWRNSQDEIVRNIEDGLSYPLFVKPANLGSSVGVRKCTDRHELIVALNNAARYDLRMIVEEAVPEAREIEVSVLGNDELKVSIPGEIVPSREFYDYHAKYLDNNSQLLIPAPLEREEVEQIQSLALQAVRAVDAHGMARVDFLVSRRDGTVYLNELNTIPGFTRISMYPKLWEASGLPFPDLIDRLIELGQERWRAKQELKTTYDPHRDD